MEKEKNPYMISIVGEQKVEGQDDRIEVITEGKYMMKNGHFLINYKEYDEDLPDKFLNNLVKVENETVTISRKGPLNLKKAKDISVCTKPLRARFQSVCLQKR